MSKRAKGDSLTGGTGDVNPQIYPLGIGVGPTSSTTTSSTVWFNQSFPVPVPKFPSTQGSALVMEVLRIRWNSTIAFDVNQATAHIMQIAGYVSTRAPPANTLPQGTLVDFNTGTTVYSRNSIYLITATRYYCHECGYKQHNNCLQYR